MKNCPKCGAINADNTEKCPNCDAEKAGTSVAAVPVNDFAASRWKAVLLSVFWCGGGQFYKREWLKGGLMFPVNLLFYPMTLFALMSIGDYEHPGAAAKILPIYIKVLCVTAPVWVWGLVDSYRCPASSTGDKGR